MAAYRGLVVDRSRRIWNLPQHDCVSADDGSNGATGAAFQKPESSEQRYQSAYARKWIWHSGRHQPHDVCGRSELPCGLRAELAALGAARLARCTSDDGNLPAVKRNAPDAAVSAEHFSARCLGVRSMPNRICICDIEWELDQR